MASYSGVRNAYIEKNKKIDEKVEADGKAYDAQRQDVQDSAADTLRQLYLQNERAQALQKQSRKAAGITGGAAESADIALQANYATNRTNTMLDRDRQLSQINIQQDQAKSQAEIDKSANLVELEQGQLAFDQDEENRALDREQLGLSKDQAAFDQEQFDYEKLRDRQSDLWKLIEAGVVTQAMADELGKPLSVLKEVAAYYKEK